MSIIVSGLLANTALAMPNKLDQIDREYDSLIDSLNSKCADMKELSSPPETTAELYCSDTPANKIYVSYCLYQNLLVSDNDKVIEFDLGISGYVDQGSSVTRVTMACKDLK